MRKLSRHAFMKWLKSFSAKNIVGTSCSSSDCPLGRFLGEGYAINYVRYGAVDEWGTSPKLETSIRSPGWAKKFAQLIDEHKVVKEFPEPTRITARVALEVLRKAR